MCKHAVSIHDISIHPLLHPLPADRSLSSLMHLPQGLYQNHGYTTGTHVAKRSKGQPHPLPADQQVKGGGGGGGSNGLVYATTHNLPIIMTFNAQKNKFSTTNKKKKSPYRGKGEVDHTHPPPVALLPRLAHCSKIGWPSPTTLSLTPTCPIKNIYNNILMCKKCNFDTQNVLNLHTLHTSPPPARSLCSLTLAPVENSWQHHCYKRS